MLKVFKVFMAVHGTENYVYYTDKVLGAGSTGTVYFGRHKVAAFYSFAQ